MQFPILRQARANILGCFARKQRNFQTTCTSPLPRNVTAHIEMAQLMAIHDRIHELHAFWMVAVTHSSCMQLYVHATSLCDCWFNGMSYSCCSRAECRPAGLSQSKPRRALNDINQLAVIVLIQILSSIHVRIMCTKVDGIFLSHCRFQRRPVNIRKYYS